MTTHRDPDALLAAYLADGMTVLSDRVIDAVLDEAHRTRQRTVRGPRRTLQMFKPMFAAAGAVIALVVGVYALGVFNPPNPDPGATASPVVSPTQTLGLPSASLVPIVSLTRRVLEPGPWRVMLVDLELELDIPTGVGAVHGELWPDARVARFDNDLGNFTIQSGLWQTNREWCEPTTDVIELPDTVDDIAEWLLAMPDADVEELSEVTVDGRRARKFDFALHDGCYDSSELPPGGVVPWQGQNERVVIYAIPTDGQAMLLMSFASAENLEVTPALRQYLDAVVESMTFPD